MLCKQLWYVVMVGLLSLCSSAVADMPEDADFAKWQRTFSHQLVQQAERLSNDTFTEAFTIEYHLLRARGVPHCRISFVGMSEFRAWLTRFAREDFATYVTALLSEFTPEQQSIIKQRCRNRQAPYICLARIDPLATIHTPAARITLDPTLSNLTYVALRETLVHEYTHYLAQGHHYHQYVALTEGMTEHLTRRVVARCHWRQQYDNVYRDEVRITELLLQSDRRLLKDWYVGHKLSNYELFDSLVNQLAPQPDDKLRFKVEQVVRNLQGFPETDEEKNINAREHIETWLARPKPRTTNPPTLATTR
ncbi:MAG: M85 family metallopeptidase [Candidatus Andersenbacteria bacterium]